MPNGAECLLKTLVACGVDVCFANPGTSEMHFVAALDRAPGMRPVLGLFEGAVTGMADGYGRMAERPAATLLHLGPGLANGLANLHNARRANTPIVNIVGDHATSHVQYDAPLASDIVGFARPVSGWVHSCPSALAIAADTARAVAAACEPPGQVATLILPADVAWNEAGGPAPALAPLRQANVSDAAIEGAAQALRSGRRCAILMRGAALKEEGLTLAGRIRSATGAVLLSDTFAPRTQRGAGRVPVEPLPYFAEHIVNRLAEIDHLILVGAKPPVSFFAYPDKPSWCVPAATQIHLLSHPHEDGVAALSELAGRLAAPSAADVAVFQPPDQPSGKFNQYTIGAVIARHLPEGAIISEEAATNAAGPAAATRTAAPHDYLMLTGGAIGQGVPVATGAAIARPASRVVCLQGDGGGMYTLQALWTQARENLDVTTIIFANRSYAILNVELGRVGAGGAGPNAFSMLDLHNPELDWVKLAEGMGVEASRATSISEFEAQFIDAIRQKGPRLIEAVLG